MPQFCCIGCYKTPIYDSELRHCEKTKEGFSYNGLRLKAKVVDVYDGDTLTVVFRYRGVLEQHKVRMLGYDSPEMKPPKDMEGRDIEIANANKARQALIDLIDDNLVIMECGEFDKYGRILGTLYTQRTLCPCRKSININAWMMKHGHGVPYTGGNKEAAWAEANLNK